MNAKTEAAMSWSEGAERVAEAQRKTLVFMASRIAGEERVSSAFKGAISEEVFSQPQPLDAMSVDALYDYKANVLRRELDAVEARIHDVGAAICRAQGDAESETWHRLRARAHRTQDPQDDARARTAWADMMAVMYLRQGKQPEPGEHGYAEIVAAMQRVRP